MKSLSTVEKAIDVLYALAASKGGLGVTATATDLGLKKTTAHQLLTALRQKGLVEQSPDTKHYRLGPRIVTLSQAYLRSLDIPKTALPLLENLRDISGETTILYMLSGSDLVVTARVEGVHRVRRVVDVGSATPIGLYGASENIILAFLPESEKANVRQAVIDKKLLPPGQHPGDYFKAFEDELRDIVKKGYAMNTKEGPKGEYYLAAPFFNASDRVIGGVVIAGPGIRFTTRAMRKVVEPLLRTVNRLSFLNGSTRVVGPV